MADVKTVSVIVPCFNEQATVDEFYRRMSLVAESMGPVVVDMIFVDDCSRDDTPSKLVALAANDPRVKFLRLARNSGHQVAVTAGLDYADGDAVVIIDADLQDPPEAIPEMIELVRQGFDVVHAQRESREGESWFKLGTARLFYALLAKLSKTRIIEDCGDFRAFSSSAAEAMRSFREPHRFLRGLFSLVGFRQCIYRFKRRERFAGATNYTLRKMVRLASDAMFSFSSTPVRAILWVAASLWALSLIYLVVNLAMWFAGRTVPGWTSIIVLMTVFTGLILASIAVIGAYVGRIFEQGQERPLYWIADMRNIDADRPLRSGFESREMKLSQSIARLRLGGSRPGRAEPPDVHQTAIIAEPNMTVFVSGQVRDARQAAVVEATGTEAGLRGGGA